MEGEQTGYSDYPLTCRTDSKLPFEVRVHVCLTEHYGHRTTQHRGDATMTLPMGKPVTVKKKERARHLSYDKLPDAAFSWKATQMLDHEIKRSQFFSLIM